MQVTVTICCTLLLFAISLGAQDQSQQDQPDPYSISLVQRALSLHSIGVRNSIVEKNIPRCGDKASIALVKLDTDFSNPKTVRLALALIRDAFSRPQAISTEVDKQPRVTLLLLNYLRQKMLSDVQTRQDIEQTIGFVNRASGSAPVSQKEQK
jgi:hypothetical protein